MSTEVERLRAEVERLAAENESLREAEPAVSARPRRRGRAWASAIALVLAAVTVPLSVVAGWTRAELADEQSFVDTFGPLVAHEAVQDLVGDAASTAIADNLDIAGFTDDLFDGLAALGLPDEAQAALELVRQPAAAGVQGLLSSVIDEAVRSEAFAAVWETSLVATHRALVAAATGGADSVVEISGDGTVGIHLGPIVEHLKPVLVDGGLGFVADIPPIDATIVLAQAEALGLIGPAYTLAVTAGYVLPVLSLVLLALGILFARSRARGVLGAGVALGLGALAVVAALLAGRGVLTAQAPALGLPVDAVDVVYDTLTGRMEGTAIALAVAGLALVVAGWIGGPWAPARRLRTATASLVQGARRGLRSHGLTTGRFGEALHRQRVLVRVVLLVLVVVALVLLSPLTVGSVLGVVLIGLVLWACAELLAAPPEDLAGDVAEDRIEDAAVTT